MKIGLAQGTSLANPILVYKTQCCSTIIYRSTPYHHKSFYGNSQEINKKINKRTICTREVVSTHVIDNKIK